MKDKHTTRATLTDNIQPAVVIQPPIDFERISQEEKTLVDMVKQQRDLALAHADTAIANGRLAEANHRNVILTLAIKYHLADGDLINEDGTITRK